MMKSAKTSSPASIQHHLPSSNFVHTEEEGPPIGLADRTELHRLTVDLGLADRPATGAAAPRRSRRPRLPGLGSAAKLGFPKKVAFRGYLLAGSPGLPFTTLSKCIEGTSEVPGAIGYSLTQHHRAVRAPPF